MRTVTISLAVIFPATPPEPAKSPSVIAADQEPQHHPALLNDFVKVFKVEIAAGDSIILNRRGFAAVEFAVVHSICAVVLFGSPYNCPDSASNVPASGSSPEPLCTLGRGFGRDGQDGKQPPASSGALIGLGQWGTAWRGVFLPVKKTRSQSAIPASHAI
jgi:hypothetical protein